jgi:thiamine biosynthesis lipoprotein
MPLLNCLKPVFYVIFSFLSLSLLYPSKKWNKYIINGEAQGTTYHLVYYAEDGVILKTDIDSIFRSIDNSLSIYNSNSLISQFNASVRGVKANKMLSTVVAKAKEISVATNGISDITVLPLVNAWGFGPIKSTRVPDSIQVADLLQCISYKFISLIGDSLLKKKPCVSIDVNGIAQGYSVDLIAEWLAKNNVHNYLVEVGGEIRVSGRKQPSGEPMIVGIEMPGSHDFGPEKGIKSISMSDGAITTSGNYRKFFSNGGKTFAHLIDPVTGYPFSNELISVTVKAADAITADGYDNALMGMGLQKALQFLSTHPELRAYFIYKNKDGVVRDTASLGF